MQPSNMTSLPLSFCNIFDQDTIPTINSVCVAKFMTASLLNKLSKNNSTNFLIYLLGAIKNC